MKNLRKKIQTIDLDYIYNFDQKIITLSNIQIDNVFDQDLNKKLNNICTYGLYMDYVQNI